jgi:hypothetical protein
VRPEDLRQVAGEAAGYNPFATFFKDKEPGESGEPGPETKETSPPE